MNDYQSPYSSSRRWLRGNLHLHTCCGPYVDLAETGPRYAQLGYDFLAVTDHDRSPEKQVWERWCREAQVTLIPGVERSVPEHILHIGVEQVHDVATGQYETSAKMLQNAGGFLVGCHPQEYNHGAKLIRQAATTLHAFEIYNALRAKRGCNESANVTLWDELLTAGHRIWAVATDDFHKAYLEPGNAWVCVQATENAEPLTWPELVEHLKAGRFYASTGPEFKALRWEANRLHVLADAETQRLRVLGPEGQVLIEHLGTQLIWPTPAGLPYFRVEAVAGTQCAWSQPFWKNDA